MEVKSSSVESTRKYVRDTFGADHYERWLNSLSEKSKAIFKGMILSTPWYPIQDGMVQPTLVCGQLFFNGDANKAAREMGYFSGNLAFTGLYKLLARLATPRTFIERNAKVLGDFFQGITSKTVTVDKTTEKLLLYGFTEPLPIVENRIAGWLEAAFTKCSAKNAKMKIIRPSSGTPGDYCEMVATWLD